MSLRRLLPIPALAAACGLLAAAGVAEAATKERGVQRRYAGAQWSPSGSKYGFYAKLRLDRAVARDSKRGGYIAQTLWVGTDNGTTAYGKNTRAPYIQVSVSRGFRGRGGNHLVLALRKEDGRYFEDRSEGPAVKFGQAYAFTVVAQVGGHWTISLGPDTLAEVDGMGEGTDEYFGSSSAFAGIESTSSRNKAKGQVSDLARLEIVGKGAGAIPGWNLGGDKNHSRLIRRGPATADWVQRDFELTNSFGR